MTVLVAGGAGVAGECVVHELLRRGTDVVVPSRSRQRLDALLDAAPVGVGRLHTVLGDVGTEPGAAAVRAEIAVRVGPLSAVVASLGPWWEGAPLVRTPTEVWDRILRDNLTAHFHAARAFLPAITDRDNAVYLMLAGIAAGLAAPNSGPISVTGAAQRMLLRTLAVESTGGVRFHEVAIMTPIVTRHWDEGPPEPGWLTGEQVGSYVADVLEPDFPDRDRLLLELGTP